VAGDALRSTWLLALVIFAITWPVRSLVPHAGLDSSWRAGLYMAAHDHLRFGPELTFTHGPLGFLRYPFLYYVWLTRLAGLYVGLVHLGLCLTLLWALRRAFSLTVAAVLTFAIAAVLADEPVLAIALVWAVEALREGGNEHARRLFPLVGGLASGLEVLVKANSGVTLLAMCALTVACLPAGRRARSLAEFGGGFVVAFLGLWLAASQRLGDIPDYVVNSASVAAGHSDTMLREAAPRWEYAGAIVVMGLVVWLLVDGFRSRLPVRRWPMVGVLAVFAFSLWKLGFVRHDATHSPRFFATFLAAIAAFAWSPRQRISVILILAVTFAAFFGTVGPDRLDVFDARARITAGWDQLRIVTDSHRHGSLVDRARRSMQGEYRLSPEMLAQLSGHSVHVEPFEASLVWGYGQRWRPLPVFQSYVAYTPRLDRVNADFLRSGKAPERIVREVAPVDGRNQQFDAPDATREMLCRYRQLIADAHWQILGRVATRCGMERLLGRRTAGAEIAVGVPRAPTGEAVLVRVSGVAPGGLERLRGLLLRPSERRIRVVDDRGGDRTFRLAPLTAQDGTLVRVPREADWPAPFRESADARTLAITIGDGSSRQPLVYSFYALPIRP
jgi:hypothetical protein